MYKHLLVYIFICSPLVKHLISNIWSSWRFSFTVLSAAAVCTVRRCYVIRCASENKILIGDLRVKSMSPQGFKNVTLYVHTVKDSTTLILVDYIS